MEQTLGNDLAIRQLDLLTSLGVYYRIVNLKVKDVDDFGNVRYEPQIKMTIGKNGVELATFISKDIASAIHDAADWCKRNGILLRSDDDCVMEWISVDEQLPPCGDEDYFLLGEDDLGHSGIPDVGYMHYSPDGKPCIENFVTTELVRVTHWMKIILPKELR